ncbi:MAG: hypothetical protein JW828_11590 [Sedimentisphaerales bacterium]|nr:hypothetical protein [Sedimentisphaerales bacterium]
MLFQNLLAQAEPVNTAGNERVVESLVDMIWQQITVLTWLQAVLAVSFGIVYMLYGWRIFRILVVISFGLIGMILGIMGGRQMGSEVLGGLLGCALLAFISVPLMKWCVCLLGAAAGGIITGGLWYAFHLPQVYAWAGALVGVVAGGMISFIVLKAAVMLFTSLGGSTIVVVGILSLLDKYEALQQPPTTHIQDLVYNTTWFMPVVIIAPTILGIIMQNRFIKQSHKWEF